MDIHTLLKLLYHYLSIYWPEQLDQSLKPKDSAGNKECRNITFDFIIVGAGTSGCILANRLSANPELKVLLIEAGGDEDYITDTPALAYRLIGSKYDWKYNTTEQENVCRDRNGSCAFPRGKVMGGTSTINEMLYARGNPKHYDQWEAMGNPGWNYNSALKYFKKVENVTISEFATDTEYRSTNGPLPIGYPQWRNNISEIYMRSAIEDYNLYPTDYNRPQNISSNFVQSNLNGATRWSTSKAYLNPIRDRNNLYIFKNTLAIKILFSEDDNKRAIGVTCVTNGEQYNMSANKEVILAAGAIETPKLLMLSGVGPAEHLQELGIPLVIDLPVGQNFKDQPIVTFNYRVNLTDLQYSDERFNNSIKEYAMNKTGLLSAPNWILYSLLNSSDFLNKNTMPTHEYIDAYALPPLTTFTSEPCLSDSFFLLSPESVGTVTLKSNNYEDQPLINPNYLSVDSDIEITMKALEECFYALGTPVIKTVDPVFIPPPNCEYPGNVTIEYTKCFIKYQTSGGMNPSSTAKMGPESDKTSVVDSELKVHGLEGIRVADNSIIPCQPNANLFATELMIGEKASDIILQSYN